MSDLEPAPTRATHREVVPLLACLAVLHATCAALGVRAPVSAAVDVTLAGVLAVATLTLRARSGGVLLGLLLASAAASGLRVGTTGSAALGAGALLAVVGALAVASTRAAALVVAASTSAFAAGSAVVAVRTGGWTAQGWTARDWTESAAVAVVLLAAGAAVLTLRRATAEQVRVAEVARRTADALRVTDPLTGTLNRSGLELMAGPMIESARRRGEAVHALFIDIDGFAEVNHEIGYGRGDDVLMAVAEALRGSIRTTDVVCRVGGDEFAVLGPGTGTSPLEMERRLRVLLHEAPPVPVTIWDARLSIGSATLVPWDDGDLRGLLGRADQDMRLRRSLRRQSHDRRGDVAAPPQGTAPRSEV